METSLKLLVTGFFGGMPIVIILLCVVVVLPLSVGNVGDDEADDDVSAAKNLNFSTNFLFDGSG